QLSVAHIHAVKRQLRVLAGQGLGDTPVVLVCNAVTADQQSQVSLKAAERALGRSFDVVAPEDRRVVNSATNEGLEIAAVRRGTQIERAGELLAARVVGQALAPAPTSRRLF